MNTENVNLQIIIGVVVLGVMGGSLVGPILPAMIEPLHASKETIGWILSIYTLFALLFTPVLGSLSDRLGRKEILVPTTLTYGFAGLSIAFTSDFHLVLLLRAFQGIGVAGMMNLGVILIGDLYVSDTRAQVMGYRTSAQNITTATVPFVAGVLATVGWYYPFFLYALAIPVGILAIFKLKIGKPTTTPSIKEYFSSIYNAMLNSKTVLVFLSNFLAFVLLYCLIVHLPLLLTEALSLSTFYAGLANSVFSGISAVVASQSGQLNDIFSSRLLVVTGFTSCGVSLILLPLGRTYIVILLFLIFWGVGFGIITPTISTLATELAPKRLRAGVVSGFSSMTYIGQTVSPPLFGLVLRYTNLQFVFTVAGCLAFIPMLLAGMRYIVPTKQ
ncbi:MAG: MFS transporter [Candidatus Korarchaeota archaeon]|nr:MFS transporter [Candidatus Korarchaeota archaeon]NIU81936.1 MFS transporter [Candidatus Thorarchaeota archaeon]NIW12394.1 MFS transporter [Candidatus Thorarchaeota archaeon]NIW51186.1 MFS transporter [Candidatus Korarchaeota archaeon]